MNVVSQLTGREDKSLDAYLREQSRDKNPLEISAGRKVVVMGQPVRELFGGAELVRSFARRGTTSQGQVQSAGEITIRSSFRFCYTCLHHSIRSKPVAIKVNVSSMA